ICSSKWLQIRFPPSTASSVIDAENVINVSGDDGTDHVESAKTTNKRKTSTAWEDFSEVNEDGRKMAKCNHCFKKLVVVTGSTTSLLRHQKTCVIQKTSKSAFKTLWNTAASNQDCGMHLDHASNRLLGLEENGWTGGNVYKPIKKSNGGVVGRAEDGSLIAARAKPFLVRSSEELELKAAEWGWRHPWKGHGDHAHGHGHGLEKEVVLTQTACAMYVPTDTQPREVRAITALCCVDRLTLTNQKVQPGRSKKASRDASATQLSTEHNASNESVKEELRMLHPDDSQIVVLKHKVWPPERSIGDAHLKKAEFNREPLLAKFRLPEPFHKPILISSEPSTEHWDS
ncbi:hypothetical protein IFM89_029432, partial [Coptis chinensis]